MEDVNRKKVIQKDDFILALYDDKKDKWESCEVSCTKTYKQYRNTTLEDIIGFGRTKEEALENFIEEFNKYYQKITEFRDRLLSEDIIPYIEVDCVRKPLQTDRTRAVKLMERKDNKND